MAETPCPLDKAKWPKLKGKCHMCGCEVPAPIGLASELLLKSVEMCCGKAA